MICGRLTSSPAPQAKSLSIIWSIKGSPSPYEFSSCSGDAIAGRAVMLTNAVIFVSFRRGGGDGGTDYGSRPGICSIIYIMPPPSLFLHRSYLQVVNSLARANGGCERPANSIHGSFVRAYHKLVSPWIWIQMSDVSPSEQDYCPDKRYTDQGSYSGLRSRSPDPWLPLSLGLP